jgi:hypothetical protein
MSHRPFPDVVYHLTSHDGLERIMESGGIKPQLNPLGSYVLDPETLASNWLRTTRFFGSPIQGLILGIFGRGHTEIIVLKVTLLQDEDEIVVYDLRSVFDSASPGPYLSQHFTYSGFPYSAHAVPEMIVRHKRDGVIPCERIEVMHTVPISRFGGMKRLRRERLEPSELLTRLLNQEQTPLPVERRRQLFFIGWQYRLLLLRGAVHRFFVRSTRTRAG